MKYMGDLDIVKIHKKRLYNKKHCKAKSLNYKAQPISLIAFGYLKGRGIWTSVITRMVFNPKTKVTRIYARNNKWYTVPWKEA